MDCRIFVDAKMSCFLLVKNLDVRIADLDNGMRRASALLKPSSFSPEGVLAAYYSISEIRFT